VLIHQSDLSAMNRCGEQHRRSLAGHPSKQLSATAYGSVIHHALHTLERTRDLELALNTFEHYWHPNNIDAICEPVQEWIARHSYSGLLRQGLELLKRYWDLKAYDDETVLALEIPFVVPIGDTGHHLAGTIDRLAVRSYQRKPYLCVDDWKSGRKKTYLKYNLQHIAYSYATTQPEFWLGNPEYLTEGWGAQGQTFLDAYGKYPRRGFWIDCSTAQPHWNDCGIKDEQDYQRFFRGVRNYAAMREREIFPLAIEGEVCQFCSYRDDCPEGVA
jgi:hypothetical protein